MKEPLIKRLARIAATAIDIGPEEAHEAFS